MMVIVVGSGLSYLCSNLNEDVCSSLSAKEIKDTSEEESRSSSHSTVKTARILRRILET